MARKKKGLKAPGFMRSVLAENVSALMERRLPTYGDKVKELARRAGMSRSSVQRMAEGSHGASIDLLERVADALGVTVYQLVTPGLNPARPPEIPGARAMHARALRQWKRGRGTP